MQKNCYLVVGLGATGLSCVRYLLSQNQFVIVADSRENPPKLAEFKAAFPHIEMHLGKFSQAVFDQADTLIVSPGVSLQEPCIQHCLSKNIPVIGDVEIFAREAKAPIVAITGSNGKSTLTTLMGELITNAGLKAVVCGNIGLPVLDALSQPVPDYYVVELSSFQLDTTYSLKAKVAVVINVSPDHMDRYASLADYKASKQRVYHDCENAVVNVDEPDIWQSLSFQKTPIEFTLQHPNEKQWGLCDGFLAQGKNKLIPVSELCLQQRHNNQNYLAALAMGSILKLPMESMLNTLRQFTGLAHRCQLVKKSNGVAWFNDSKATNVGAAIAAIESMAQTSAGKLILLAGGDSKGVSLLPLQEPVKKYVSRVILFGKDADLLLDALQNCAEIIRVKTLREGVQIAKNTAQSGDIVLLAPACASLDQYENYAARGRDFERAVNEVGS
jgi:UDP-N-acetylmuramoylalanine--D-glutamate ligase